MLDDYRTHGRTQGRSSMLQAWNYFVIMSLTFQTFQTNEMIIQDSNI
jgi:hypothetical protein